MRRSLKLLPMLILLMLCFPIGSGAVISSKTATPNRDVGYKSQVVKVVKIRHGIQWHRSRTWSLQSKMIIPRTPTNYAEKHTESTSYLQWIKKLWTKRQNKARKIYHSSHAYLRFWIHHYHSCLAGIIDLEDGSYDPTVNFGGGHGNTSVAYGLPQADPGTKLAYYSYTNGGHYAGQKTGKDWATNPWVQLRWMKNYAIGKFGSECAAYNHRITYHTY